jgi:hypothetical protein
MKLAYPTPHAAMKEWLNRIGDDPAVQRPDYFDVYSPKRRVYASGNVIYSYGSHFPLARWIPEHKLLALNTDRYSVTTSRHQSYMYTMARYAQPSLGCEILRLSYNAKSEWWLVDMFPEKVVEYYDHRIRHRAGKVQRSRCERSRLWHTRATMEWIAERNIVTRMFAPERTELPEDVAAALVIMKLTEQ